jgi:flagellar basal-body rod protein FlgB
MRPQVEMMIDRILNSSSYLEKGLDAAWKRHKVILNNIANADTPGFKSSRVTFESAFKSAVEGMGSPVSSTGTGQTGIDTSQIPDIPIEITQNTENRMRLDGNNVDIDYEMTQLAQNTLFYDALIQKISSEFSRLRMAIREGK